MGRIYSVTLPRTRIARFPDCCVVCRKPQPGAMHAWSAVGGSIPSALVDASPLGADKVKTKLPACSGCFQSMWWRRIGVGVLEIACVLLPALILFPIVKRYVHPDFGIYVLVLAAVLGAIVRRCCFHLFFPAPLRLRLKETTLTYHFCDEHYAEAFAALNNTEID